MFDLQTQLPPPSIINVNVYRGNCPCNCIHCPLGVTPPSQRINIFGESHMELNVFKSIIDQVKAIIPQPVIRIHSAGEPTLWKHLTEAVQYCYENNVKTWLFTSATITAPELYKVICENVDIIEVSVNSTSKQDYLKTKGIDLFDTVLSNLELMSQFPHKRLIVSRVESGNKDLDKCFIDYWLRSKKVEDAFVRSYHDYNHILKTKSQIEIDTNKDRMQQIKDKGCRVHFTRFNIDTDGMAVICFNELFKQARNSAIELGNVLKIPIMQIWYGEKLSQIRTSALTDNYKKFPALCCRTCKFCQPINTDQKTSEYQINNIKSQY